MENPLIAVHQGGGGAAQLWFTVFNGKSWSPDQPIPLTAPASPPAAVVFKNDLIVLYQTSAGGLEYAKFDGYGWKNPEVVPGAAPTSSPAAVVISNRLYCFYQGSDQSIFYNVFNGTSWSVATETLASTAGAPSVALYDDRLYLFHSDAQGQGNLLVSEFDGLTWSDDAQIPGVGLTNNPCAVVSGDGKTLRVFFQGANADGSLWYVTHEKGSWPEGQVTGVTLDGGGSPGAGAIGSNLVVTYQQANTAWLYYATSSDGSTWSAPAQVPNVGTSSAPSLVNATFGR